jgi:hypothetical protein
MKYRKTGAVAGLIIAGALVLAGCGDKDKASSEPSMSPSGMMSGDDDMMSSSPTPSAMMSDDGMMSDG